MSVTQIALALIIALFSATLTIYLEEIKEHFKSKNIGVLYSFLFGGIVFFAAEIVILIRLLNDPKPLSRSDVLAIILDTIALALCTYFMVSLIYLIRRLKNL